MAEPQLAEHMTMYVDGGGKFTEMRYRVYADGEPTNIYREKRTSGRPRYEITDDILRCGDEVFDIKATKGVGVKEWIVARLSPSEPAPEGD